MDRASVYGTERPGSSPGRGAMTECNGICIRASDLIEGYGNDVAYPHDECPAHGLGWMHTHEDPVILKRACDYVTEELLEAYANGLAEVAQ